MTEIKDLSVVETRKLASFRTVDAIEPIEGADAIELAVIGGWKVVTKKGEFQPGDPCVYFEIDSFMPDGVPAWQFLVDKSARIFNGVKGHKLRTIKLRGQISQGLILPTRAHLATQLVLSMDEAAFAFNALTCTEAEIAEAKYLRFGMNEHSLDPRDLNLNKLLGIVKWEPLMSAQLAGMAEGLFPNFIRKTDQERCVSGDTMIETAEGPIRMDDLCAMDVKPMIKSFDHHTGEQVFKKCLGVSIMRRGGDWLKITTATGKTMIITNNHRVWCEDLQAYRLAGNLKIGQQVLTQD